MKKPTIVNLFGGPGIGKSTAATAVFSLLKMHGVDVEYVAEFAKDCTWEDRHTTLRNQYYIWAKQFHRIWRVQHKVDVIVTDPPPLLNLVYGDTPDSFKQIVLELFNNNDNINFLLQRITNYNEEGRNEILPEARVIDNKVKNMLDSYKITYSVITSDYKDINNVVSNVLELFYIEHTLLIEDIIKEN